MKQQSRFCLLRKFCLRKSQQNRYENSRFDDFFMQIDETNCNILGRPLSKKWSELRSLRFTSKERNVISAAQGVWNVYCLSLQYLVNDLSWFFCFFNVQIVSSRKLLEVEALQRGFVFYTDCSATENPFELLRCHHERSSISLPFFHHRKLQVQQRKKLMKLEMDINQLQSIQLFYSSVFLISQILNQCINIH